MTDDVWGDVTCDFLFKGNGSEFAGYVWHFFGSEDFWLDKGDSTIEVHTWYQIPDCTRGKNYSKCIIFRFTKSEGGWLHVTGECKDFKNVVKFKAFVNYCNEIERSKEILKKSKPGRHHYKDDIDAHNQVYVEHKKMDEVKAEWLNKISNDKNRSQINDPDRQFRLIMEEDWGK
jgi:hypothetical protein